MTSNIFHNFNSIFLIYVLYVNEKSESENRQLKYFLWKVKANFLRKIHPELAEISALTFVFI